jgi:chemotaxis protein MotB
MAIRRPIIIIKKKVGHSGHHGGAWKVAYADFVTAMMALFIVLWLLNSSVKVRKAVAGYFNDPRSEHRETGSDKVGNDDSIPIDKQSVQKLKEQIQKAIKSQPDLEKLAKQIEITITPEGLRIELIEDKSGTFFQSGSAKLSQTGQELLGMLAGQLKPLPNHLLLEGHTDAQPYSTDNGYTNWELSADRANSARRLLQQDGVGKSQISQVRGYADQLLRVKNDPLDPTNRRISLIVQWVEVPAPAGPTEGGKEGEPKESAKAASPAPEKAEANKPVATTPKPSAATAASSAPVPNKAGLLDKLKKMMPGDRAAKK